MPKHKNKINKSDVLNIAEYSVKVFEKGTLQEQRVLVRSLINKIVLKDDEVIIH